MRAKAAHLLLIFAAWDFPFHFSIIEMAAATSLGFFNFLQDEHCIPSPGLAGCLWCVVWQEEPFSSLGFAGSSIWTSHPHPHPIASRIELVTKEFILPSSEFSGNRQGVRKMCVEQLCELCLTPDPRPRPRPYCGPFCVFRTLSLIQRSIGSGFVNWNSINITKTLASP